MSVQLRPAIGVACLVWHQEQILLIQRKGPHGKGTWSTPGGHLEFGESPANCARRETFEETGIEISEPEFVCLSNDLFGPQNGLPSKHYITIWMQAHCAASALCRPDPNEVTEAGWFQAHSLPTPLFLSLHNLLSGDYLASRPLKPGLIP